MVAPSPETLAKIGDLAAAAGLRRIHLLSWRDLEDPEAGGSEVHAAELARHWAAAGLDVTWRTSYASGHPTEVRRDGYRVIRRAGRYLVFPRAAFSEMTGRHGPSDALLEIWNGMPFFSPLWYRGPRAVMLHHVHAEMWQMVLGEDNPLLARVGDLIEGRIAPAIYRRSRIITPSESARDEIVSMLRIPASRIDVVHNGIGTGFRPGGRKTPEPSVIVVGRLVPVKRHDLMIRAAALARAEVPGLSLTIVGEGYERERLQSVIDELGAEDWVRLVGRLHQDDLVEHYQRAWVASSASAREGWGLSLTEAAACGTPAVATRIAGHSDAVRDGVTGILTEGTAPALAAGLVEVLTDDARREQLRAGALERAAGLSWERTALGVMQSLASQAAGRRR